MQTIGLYGIPVLSLVLIIIGFNSTEAVNGENPARNDALFGGTHTISHVVTLGGIRLVLVGFSMWILWPFLLY